MLICKTCGHENEPDRIHCWRCGVQLDLTNPRSSGRSSPKNIGSAALWEKFGVAIGIIVIIGWLSEHTEFGRTIRQQVCGYANGLSKSASKYPAEEPPPSSQSLSASDEQYYLYLKTKFDDENSPLQRAGMMKQYLQRYPSGRHSGEATALLELAQKAIEEAPKVREHELLQPLIEQYSQLEARFASGITYGEFVNAYANLRVVHDQLEENSKLIQADAKKDIKEVEIVLDLTKLFWDEHIKNQRSDPALRSSGAPITRDLDEVYPPASNHRVQEWLATYPELKDALMSKKFSYELAYPIMMTTTAQKMRAARAEIAQRLRQ